MKIVKCRYCGKKFDRDKESFKTGTGEGLGGDRFYYHAACVEKAKVEPKNKWPVAQEKENQLIKNCDYMYDYLAFYLKVPADYSKIYRQAYNFMNGHNTQKIHCKPQGMFLALQYAYDVKHIDPLKGEGGIGIVPYVYKEAFEYWEQKAKHDQYIVEKIYKQMDELRKSERSAAPVRKKHKQKQTKIKTYSLSDIVSGSEE